MIIVILVVVLTILLLMGMSLRTGKDGFTGGPLGDLDWEKKEEE